MRFLLPLLIAECALPRQECFQTGGVSPLLGCRACGGKSQCRRSPIGMIRHLGLRIWQRTVGASALRRQMRPVPIAASQTIECHPQATCLKPLPCRMCRTFTSAALKPLIYPANYPSAPPLFSPLANMRCPFRSTRRYPLHSPHKYPHRLQRKVILCFCFEGAGK
jgi:hypothetical protein